MKLKKISRMKKIVLLLLLVTSSTLLAQKDNFWLYGKLKDSSSVVKNANIINLKTNKGTFVLSSEIGRASELNTKISSY